jgi:origin recognition complex subunit 5
MLAILGALLEENDTDTRLSNPDFTIPGEHTDMEISRVGVYSAVRFFLSFFLLPFVWGADKKKKVMQLVSQHLLLRTSSLDRIDGPPMFKCNVALESVLGLAKGLEVGLMDLLWESSM